MMKMKMVVMVMLIVLMMMTRFPNPLATGRGTTNLTWQGANLLEVRRVVRVGIDQHLAMRMIIMIVATRTLMTMCMII